MAGTLAVEEPPKEPGHRSSFAEVRTPLSAQTTRARTEQFFLFFDILVTVPLGTFNMHLKFEMPQKYKIKALSMQIVYVCMYRSIMCVYTYIHIYRLVFIRHF